MPARKLPPVLAFYLASLAALTSWSVVETLVQSGFNLATEQFTTMLMYIAAAAIICVGNATLYAVTLEIMPRFSKESEGRLRAVSAATGAFVIATSWVLITAAGLLGDPQRHTQIALWVLPLAIIPALVLYRCRRTGYLKDVPKRACPGCGYDMTDAPIPRCPECGEYVPGLKKRVPKIGSGLQ